MPLEAAQVLAEIHHLRAETSRALGLLDQLRTRLSQPLTFEGATIAWRRAAALRRLGRPTATDELDQAIDALAAAQPLFATRDLLAALVEQAIRVADQDPAYSARLLAWVRCNRRDWTLPFGMDDEIPRLLGALLPRHQADHGSDLTNAPLPLPAG